MVEPGKDAPLRLEAFARRAQAELAPDELDRNRLRIDAVVALRFGDHAHAAVGDRAHDSEGPDPRGQAHGPMGRREEGLRVEQRGTGEQFLDPPAQRRVTLGAATDEIPARGALGKAEHLFHDRQSRAVEPVHGQKDTRT